MKWREDCIATHSYTAEGSDISLVLVKCLADKPSINYAHYTRRVTKLEISDKVDKFRCYLCKQKVKESEFAMQAPFFCEHCDFCICLECKHAHHPPEEKPIYPKFCLTQTKKILSEFVSCSPAPPEVDDLLFSCKGELLEAMKKFRNEHEPTSLPSSPAGLLPESMGTLSSDVAILKLTAAVTSGDLAGVKKLIEQQGVDMSTQLPAGRSALHVAAGHGHIKIVEYLVSVKANVNAPDEDGDGALAHCAQEGHIDVARELLRAGAYVDMASQRGDLTPLMRATLNGREEMVELLIERGAVVDNLNSRRDTAAHLAVLHNRPGALAVLISKGASLDILNNINFTPLHLAAKVDSKACCDLLLRANADVKRIDEEGRTAMHTAAAFNSWNVLEALVDHDKSLIDFTDSGHNTPLHEACKVYDVI